jgi:hypothetical protein
MDAWEGSLDDLGATVAANPTTGTVCITLHVDAVSLAQPPSAPRMNVPP